MPRYLPIPRVDPLAWQRAADRGADVGAYVTEFPLAGSAYAWFDSVNCYADDGRVEDLLATELDAGTRHRLSARRSDLCGLTLDRPRVMGIVNVTPDSFSDGGDRASVAAAVAGAEEMVAAGVDILDIGGDSTRPGAETVADTEEIHRVVPVIRAIRDAGIRTPISIDTRKSAVAARALEAGADLVNDVSALRFDSVMAGLVAEREVPVCLMHAKGAPKDMQDAPRYDDVLGEVFDFLGERMDAAIAAGIARDRIVTDPGIGFGKTLAHNLALLRGLALFHDLGAPILLGASRKRFIGTLSEAEAPKARMPGSLAVAQHGAGQGVHILRVHDVLETRQALDLWRAMHEQKDHVDG
ncbi:MAG: dihydropteroate synthase [Pseudomonadota bacterium]